ncbi:hypothetical protein CN327_15605 [Bacillus cereus]|nr:hypothetical protein CON53_26135 [Bacillus cereus]PES79312.1 hypothetical protein CN509_11700 [Bacillus cereus]PET04802.1 hypothetical protein CN505_14390 [Bacillus cereus]PFF32655.1 hypothetical protein CN327_15605 [Bacillus cereus]PFH84534.1 hypothetical protein COI81_21520 [Bacillus cereus]
MRVLITGGNRGLGLELVKVFHENGHVVYPLVRTEVSVMKSKKMFSSRCFPILADLTDDESTECIKKQVEEYTGYIEPDVGELKW